ncbi:response regulator [Sphingomonas sp.]|uniref:response regulator n=1 Tax=Sphingomonas sp. TaxID=28214 RepID=UPI003B3B6E3C
MHRSAPEGYRVLIAAPYGRDAQSMHDLLSRHGYAATTCPSIADIAGQIGDDIGAILVTEEALVAELTPLDRALAAQPAWSDVPFILLAGRRAGREASSAAIRRRLPQSAINVVLLERPLSAESLISAIDSAMRSRQKQIEIRDRITELDAEKARLATLLDHLPVGVAFVGPDGGTLLSNPAFRRFQPTGEIPSRLEDGEERWVGYDENGERIRRDRFVSVRTLRGETVEGVEFLYHPDDGAAIWTRVSGVPLTDAHGQIIGSISVVVDIDEQKRTQEALAYAAQKFEAQVGERTAELEDALARLKAEVDERERAEAALRQSQKMEAVGQLTGGIAHDFNNMLTGIIGAIDIMKRRIASNRIDDLDRFMDAASTSAQRAASLTARLLAFSRRQSLDSRPTDVGALVQSLGDLLDRTMSEQIDVAILPGDGVPAAMVDANQLENAILNLAINARDAMPVGGTLTIETNLVELADDDATRGPSLPAGHYVAVTVSDTGTGMDAETIEKAVEPFYTTKPIGQGTGLGLSMVYGFAQQSNGQVRIHSTPGVGTSVSIHLPVAEGYAPTEPAEPTAPAHEGSGQTVLLVEDDASVRLLIREVLEELGYVVAEAAEPEAAIALLERTDRFDLMISDVGLPGMNGRQLADIARTHMPDLPILFVTGYAENATLRSGFLGTNMAMITKPFQIERLSAKIGEMLTYDKAG